MGEGGVGRSIESKLNKLSWKARELIDRNSFQMTSSLRTILVGHPVHCLSWFGTPLRGECVGLKGPAQCGVPAEAKSGSVIVCTLSGSSC